MAHILLWNRFVNNKGLVTTNVEADTENEHCNKVIKQEAWGFKGKISDKAIKSVGEGSTSLEKVLTQADKATGITGPLGKHENVSSILDSQDTFLPRHVSLQTRFSQDMFLSRHVSLKTRFSQDMNLSRHISPKTRFSQDMFLSRHVSLATRQGNANDEGYGNNNGLLICLLLYYLRYRPCLMHDITL